MKKINLVIDSMPGGYGGYHIETKKAKKIMKKLVKKVKKANKTSKSRAISSICNTLAITGNGMNNFIEELTTDHHGFAGIQVKITFIDIDSLEEFLTWYE